MTLSLQTSAKFYQYAEIASDNTLCGGESATDSEYIQQIETDLNNRPRKRFNFDSPLNMFNQKVAFVT